MTIKCAIYTRKSTENDYEQQFHSLDEQRLACEDYIQSQANNGWEIIEKHYDDDGYSGEITERPGFQELLRDIENGLVDCVVVYKIDRMSRSLLDFLKMVEILDKHNVNLVAVLQTFSTSNSTGRLMLNVLLSFAQFEREVTSDRIRDKIAASKKLGFWTGGYAPLGYDICNKALKINEFEAKAVRHIFEQFLELKSITGLLTDLKDRNITTKSNKQFSKKTIRQILKNPIYKGFVRHKDLEYNGRHEAIIPIEKFEAVQDIFQKSESGRPLRSSDALLKDIIRCGCCDCVMTPTYCSKSNKKYRYYVCSNHIRKKSCASANKNIPSGDVEEFATKSVKKLLQNPAITALTVHRLAADGISLDAAQHALQDIDNIWEPLHIMEKRKIIKLLIKNVVVGNDRVNILLNHDGIHELIREVAV